MKPGNVFFKKKLLGGRFIEFTGQFSLFSCVALVLFCYLVFTGVLPWWSILIAWLYKQDFVQIDLKKMFGKTKI